MIIDEILDVAVEECGCIQQKGICHNASFIAWMCRQEGYEGEPPKSVEFDVTSFCEEHKKAIRIKESVEGFKV